MHRLTTTSAQLCSRLDEIVDGGEQSYEWETENEEHEKKKEESDKKEQ